jgi:hypothetical protein
MEGDEQTPQEEGKTSSAMVETEPIVVIEGPTMSLTRQHLKTVPNFQGKKCYGQSIVTIIKHFNLNLNQLTFVLPFTLVHKPVILTTSIIFDG